ncbi:MAG TPA: marine proteobacterial sortase target protein [Burkholderiales bacterium]|nr:marine proteobacterial sortase target protein [Burkholderiales bacterium]
MSHRALSRATLPELLAFLGLAALLGLAAGLLLGGVALLLATPAYAEAQSVGQPALYLKAGDAEEPFPAPLVSTEVRFAVSGPLVRARVVQIFENPREAWAEALYVFPLPEGAAVDRMTLAVGERRLEGEIRSRDQAAAVYAAARSSGHRTALLDQERPNIFTTQVANIGPGETIVVALEYQHAARYDGNRFSLRFPMVVGPRYVPGPLRVADAARIAPPVLRPGHEHGRSNAVSIRVELDAGVPLASVQSAYHAIHQQSASPSRSVITLAEGPVRADRDFELSWTPRPSTLPQAAWFVEEKDGRHYGLLMVLPPPLEQRLRLPREVILVLDTSGSMAGASIRQAKAALALALERLAPGDRFNVIAFNSRARALFPKAREAEERAVREAIDWVDALEARGGTEMRDALRLALAAPATGDRVRQVVFLTDGAVGNEDELFGLIRSELGSSRLFTVGIGSAPNGHFMDKAARLGRGSFTFIGRIDEVAERMGELLARLEAPVLRELSVRWPDGARAEAWPARLPDLYSGEPLVVTVALDSLEGAAVVSGHWQDRSWEATVPIAAAAESPSVASVWARQKVTALMDVDRDPAASPVARERARAEIVSLALSHRLVTKYTSFVAVDRTPARPDDASLQSHAVPTLLPAGWQYESVFGELPQGATDSRLALLVGAGCLLLGLAGLLLRRRVA